MPSRIWAFKLIRRREMPRHIFMHSLIVRRVAIMIAYSLKIHGHSIDMRLVDRAAILHDICKIDSIRTGGDHALMGEQLLKGFGYHCVADIVGQHVRLKSMDLNEAMVVNYADKRVMHDKVVSLSRRFVDLMNRYGTDESRRIRILAQYHTTLDVQNIIVSSSNIDPERINDLNLIPGNYPFYCGDSLLRENGPVEQQDENVDLKRIYEN